MQVSLPAGTFVVDHHRHLAGLLNQLGAPELAFYVWNDQAPDRADVDRLRAELAAAAAAASESGQHASLAAAIHRALAAGDATAATLRGLMPRAAGAATVPAPPSRPEPAPAPEPPPAPGPRPAPRPPAAPTPVAPASSAPAPASSSPPPDPFAVTLTTSAAAPSSGGSTGGTATGQVGDELAWAVVVVAVLGVAAALWLPMPTLLVAAPLLLVAQVTLLVLDRRALRQAGVRQVPGWGWIIVAPAYLYRRARCLDQQPLQAYAFVAVGIAGRVAASVFGFGGGDLLDTSRLEAMLAAEHEMAWEQPTAGVDCPRWVEVRVDNEFDCVVRFDDGGHLTVTFRIESEAGHLSQVGTSYTNVP